MPAEPFRVRVLIAREEVVEVDGAATPAEARQKAGAMPGVLTVVRIEQDGPPDLFTAAPQPPPAPAGLPQPQQPPLPTSAPRRPAQRAPRPAAPPPPGHRDGATYEPETDFDRLNRQHAAVYEAIKDGAWRSLGEISEATGHPEASVSARLRDFRKRKYGSLTVDRYRVPDTGLFEYRLVPREQTASQEH